MLTDFVFKEIEEKPKEKEAQFVSKFGRVFAFKMKDKSKMWRLAAKMIKLLEVSIFVTLGSATVSYIWHQKHTMTKGKYR